MISCHFNGRLGNNLFQMANAISVANKVNEQVIFHPQSFAGHRGMVNVDLSIFSHEYLRGNVDDKNTKYSEPDTGYQPVPVKKDLTLCGFYQSWQYFDDVKDRLINDYFSPSKQILDKLEKYKVIENSLGICVRRGDYLIFQQNHCVLGIDYYQSAITEYFGDINQVFVFSDDYPWCKEQFGDQVEYVDADIGTQLFLMARVKHLILANSTFSWWGGYLNVNGGKIVMPEPWYGPNNLYRKGKDNLEYPNWIQHKHEAKYVKNFVVDPKDFYN